MVPMAATSRLGARRGSVTDRGMPNGKNEDQNGSLRLGRI
jgi:hypothetical protein